MTFCNSCEAQAPVQMLHIHHFLSLQTPPVSVCVPTFSLINKHRIPISRFQYDGHDGEFKKTGTRFYSNQAVERDSEFEVDPDKAREALRKLDQQLQSMSQKQINPPKIRASELKYDTRGEMREAAPEITGSFLAYFAFGLLIFSIFYNVLFLGVIKPSVDGPDSVPASTGDVSEARRPLILDPFVPKSKASIQP